MYLALRAMAGWLGHVPGIEGHGGVVGVCTWH